MPVQVRLPGAVTQAAQGGSLFSNGPTLVMLSDGSLWAWGNGRSYQLGSGIRGMQPSPVQFFPRPVSSTGRWPPAAESSYAISATGDVYARGSNGRGQIGDGTQTTARRPVLVESAATRISSTGNDVAVSVEDQGSALAAVP